MGQSKRKNGETLYKRCLSERISYNPGRHKSAQTLQQCSASTNALAMRGNPTCKKSGRCMPVGRPRQVATQDHRQNRPMRKKSLRTMVLSIVVSRVHVAEKWLSLSLLLYPAAVTITIITCFIFPFSDRPSPLLPWLGKLQPGSGIVLHQLHQIHLSLQTHLRRGQREVKVFG
jgi:hypothetical protein